MSDLKDTASRLAVLKTLLDAVKAEYEGVRTEFQYELDAAYEQGGVTRVDATLPDGKVVAKVGLIDPKPEAKVTDEAAFLAWVVATYPTEKTTRLVTEVQPAFRTKLLGEATGAGVPVDASTGEAIPGVEIRATRSRTHSVRFEKTGRDDVAAAWAAGLLGDVAPRALTGADAEPTP